MTSQHVEKCGLRIVVSRLYGSGLGVKLLTFSAVHWLELSHMPATTGRGGREV